MRNEPLAQADLAVTPIDTHAKQATMLGKSFCVSPKVDVRDDLVARIARHPKPTPTGLPHGQDESSAEVDRSFWRERGLAPRQWLKVRAAAAIVRKVIVQIDQELIKLVHLDEVYGRVSI
jgi:hypothetical protein